MRSRAASLLEVLITLALLATVAGLAAGLARDYARRLGSRTEEHRLYQAHNAVEQVAREASQALTIGWPRRGDPPQERLEFTRLAEDPARLASSATPWEAWPAAYRLSVTYTLEGGQLRRTLEGPGRPALTLVLAEGMDGFSCQWPVDQPLEVRLSLLTGQRLRTLAQRVPRWLP